MAKPAKPLQQRPPDGPITREQAEALGAKPVDTAAQFLAAGPKHDRKAFTIERVPGGWSLVTLTYNDAGLVGVEASQPDLKAMIIEQFKIASWKYWSKIG